MDDPPDPEVWPSRVPRNCSACTFALGEGEDICPMCDSESTHVWNYVHDKEGDTTYQTPYTELIVARAAAMVQREMTELCAESDAQLTFALTRPPGHHACSGGRVGFCHRNFAIDALDAAHAAGKIAVILDIDAHHGDGTEAELIKRDYGYYCSLHAFGSNIYPGTGAASSGRCLNLPLPAGAGDAEWMAALLDTAGPWIRSLGVDVIILSCGFDAHAGDTLVPLHLSIESYKCCSRFLRSLELPVFAILEGGYHLPVLGECAAAVIEPFL